MDAESDHIHSDLIRSEIRPKLITYKLLKLYQFFNANRFRIVSTACSDKEFVLGAGVSE